MISNDGNIVHLTIDQDNSIKWRYDLENVPVGVEVYFKSFLGHTLCWAEIPKEEQTNDRT